MKRLMSKKRAIQELRPCLVDYLRHGVLNTIQVCTCMTNYELMQNISQFRWMEILSVIAQLRQEGRLDMEEHEGRIKVFSLGTPKQLHGKCQILVQVEHERFKLTIT